MNTMQIQPQWLGSLETYFKNQKQPHNGSRDGNQPADLVAFAAITVTYPPGMVVDSIEHKLHIRQETENVRHAVMQKLVLKLLPHAIKLKDKKLDMFCQLVADQFGKYTHGTKPEEGCWGRLHQQVSEVFQRSEQARDSHKKLLKKRKNLSEKQIRTGEIDLANAERHLSVAQGLFNATHRSNANPVAMIGLLKDIIEAAEYKAAARFYEIEKGSDPKQLSHLTHEAAAAANADVLNSIVMLLPSQPEQQQQAA